MKKRNIWIPIVAVLLVAAIGAGIYIVPRLSGQEVAVYSVSMVGYTDYYSGSAESYGMVTTDKVQALYLSGTQTVTEILVYPGQEVKKGDVLYTYDTTLSDLAIERKDLENQQLEVSLKAAEAELKAIKAMKAIVYKPGTSTTKSDYTKSPADSSKLDTVYSTKTTGRTQTSPLYMWLKTSTKVDDAMIEYLFSQASASVNKIYVVFQTTTGNRADTEFKTHTGVCFERVYETVVTPTVPSDPSDPGEDTKPDDPSDPSESTPPSSEAPTEPEPSSEPTEPTESTPASEPTEAPTESTPEEPSEDPGEGSEEPAPEAGSGEGSGEPDSEPLPAQEKVLKGYAMTFFTPPSAPKEDNSTVQWNDGYTSAELTAMRTEKQDEINQLKFDIKIGKAELKIMQKEAEDGKVVANFAGVVSDILDPAAAMESGEPLMKVTGGGGYYVEGTVSELALGTIAKGQTVTVNSWDTGAVYEGKIVEIGSYPVEDQGYYGSSNASVYPYKVFIDESADLQEGFYVSMSYQTAEQAAGTLYLQNAFIRSEGNRSYVYVRNADGLLEKRYLECGVSTDGYMTPVYAGITEEDFLAFPYGKDVKEGAPTFEGTDQDLYGY